MICRICLSVAARQIEQIPEVNFGCCWDATRPRNKESGRMRGGGGGGGGKGERGDPLLLNKSAKMDVVGFDESKENHTRVGD